MTAAFDAAWLAGLQRRADLPPLNPRETLATADGTPIGSLEPALARALVDARQPLAPGGGGWRLAGETDEALAAIAVWLHREGHGGRWRDELLAVTDRRQARRHRGRRDRTRRRAATRHRDAGRAPRRADDAGRVWVQQRAHDKATDPGLWDTLVGGLVSAGESTCLRWNERPGKRPGCASTALERLDAFGAVTVRRPVADGYMVERIEMFDERGCPRASCRKTRTARSPASSCSNPLRCASGCRPTAFTLEAALILAAATAAASTSISRAPAPSGPGRAGSRPSQ